MRHRLLLPLLFALFILLLMAALPEPEPSRVSASISRRLVPTFTPTPPLK